jgi:hypothetical protein
LGYPNAACKRGGITGKIPFSMLGGKVYFHQSDINNLLEKGMKRK